MELVDISQHLNKIVKYHYSNCKIITDMEIVSREAELNSYWLKCKDCHGAVLIKEEELEKKEIRNKNNKLISPINKYQNKKQVKEYNPSETYKLGQTLFHPGFKDKGIVIKIKPGTGGFEKIVIKFDNVGEKMLIQGISTDESK